MNPIRSAQRSVGGLLRRATGRSASSSPDGVIDARAAEAAAKKYWRRRVAEEQAEAPSKGRPSREEAAAQKSARNYWEREVAEEKERRGTPDPPRH